MRCVGGLSVLGNSVEAFEDVRGQLVEGLEGRTGSFAVVLTTRDHLDALATISANLTSTGIARHVIGCSAESVVGSGQEIENSPALSILVVVTEGLEVAPFRIPRDEEFLPPEPGIEGHRAVFLFADPFTFPAEPWLKRFHESLPGFPILGGMASASRSPGGNRLILDGQIHEDGAVGLFLKSSPNLTIRSLVSQGCRPIGRPLLITKADRNILREVGRRPALEVLRELFEELPADDQARAQTGLHIGRVINEYQSDFDRGDFLVRNVLGADPEEGIVINDLLRVGQTVQFQVRDDVTASEDLRTLLTEHRIDHPRERPLGALLFTCNGRGSRLFPAPHHDVKTVQSILGMIPVAGFFAMGEIGPIGGQNFMHGYTASLAIFSEVPDEPGA